MSNYAVGAGGRMVGNAGGGFGRCHGRVLADSGATNDTVIARLDRATQYSRDG